MDLVSYYCSGKGASILCSIFVLFCRDWLSLKCGKLEQERSRHPLEESGTTYSTRKGRIVLLGDDN